LSVGWACEDLNIDDVGEAAIVECEGSLIGGDDALQPCDAVTRRAAVDPLRKEIPMRGSVLSGLHPSSILLVSFLALSTHVLAQRRSPLKESAVQLPDAPSRVATVTEAQTSFHLTCKGFPVSLSQHQGQTESWMRFFSDQTGYDRLSINTNAALNQDRGTAEFWGKNKGFMSSAPARWMPLAPPFGHVHHETIHGANDLEYYGHQPWAGSVILRISQQARAHPHLTSVLKTVHPQF